ncbi:MAG: MBL fold metallo-hydrolase [Candidatus Marinimicrobia bacterium]|nr:MBL fold metallo-hydrolase [Candidatus Neomarinimicrobiota bacterium]
MQLEILSVGPFEANCYLITGDGNQTLVLDPGAEPERVADYLSAHHLTVAAYALTHGHADHVCALAELARRFPAEVWLHPADAAWAFGPGNQIPGFYAVPSRPATPLRELTAAQAPQISGLTIEALETPGHSPGGVALYLPAEHTCFTGDTLFKGSVGRTDLPGGDSRALAQSLRRLAELPDGALLYPGHGPASTLGAEKKSNYFLINGLG